jgi:predicted TIM-barrel fold metal-dependent hydrolase
MYRELPRHIRLCLPLHPLIDLVPSSVGPAVEAFGFERIVFGSAPSPVSRAQSNAGDWYEIAREAFAELGVDQESVDAVFGGNAQRIYAAGSNGRA